MGNRRISAPTLRAEWIYGTKWLALTDSDGCLLELKTIKRIFQSRHLSTQRTGQMNRNILNFQSLRNIQNRIRPDSPATEVTLFWCSIYPKRGLASSLWSPWPSVPYRVWCGVSWGHEMWAKPTVLSRCTTLMWRYKPSIIELNAPSTFHSPSECGTVWRYRRRINYLLSLNILVTLWFVTCQSHSGITFDFNVDDHSLLFSQIICITVFVKYVCIEVWLSWSHADANNLAPICIAPFIFKSPSILFVWHDVRLNQVLLWQSWFTTLNTWNVIIQFVQTERETICALTLKESWHNGEVRFQIETIPWGSKSPFTYLAGFEKTLSREFGWRCWIS